MTEQNVRREISELEKLIEAGLALASKRQILADEDLKLIQRRLVVRVARQKAGLQVKRLTTLEDRAADDAPQHVAPLLV